MRIEKVKKLPVEERFLYWIRERESIRLKKEVGEDKPWTDDQILQSYRFCNVRRMDDAVSQWLLKNWYEPNIDHPNLLVAATLARQLNNPESLEEVGFPRKWNPSRVESILNKRVELGLKNFSAAYMITGTLGGTKIEQVVWKVVDPIAKACKSDRLKLPWEYATMESLAVSLCPFAGFSTFIVGQVVADVRWAISERFSDVMEWAPPGPGSKRGVSRLYGEAPTVTGINAEEFDGRLEWVIEFCTDNLSTRITDRLEAMDYQNCLCEFDKYERTLWGEGRPKRKYPGL